MIGALQLMARNCSGGTGKEGKVGVLPSTLKKSIDCTVLFFFEKQQCRSHKLMGEN